MHYEGIIRVHQNTLKLSRVSLLGSAIPHVGAGWKWRHAGCMVGHTRTSPAGGRWANSTIAGSQYNIFNSSRAFFRGCRPNISKRQIEAKAFLAHLLPRKSRPGDQHCHTATQPTSAPSLDLQTTLGPKAHQNLPLPTRVPPWFYVK